MSWRPSAPGSQLRKWSNDRFSIIRITTCWTPFEPSGNRAGAALAAARDRSSGPVAATPADAPISCRKVRRVSMAHYKQTTMNIRRANHVAARWHQLPGGRFSLIADAFPAITAEITTKVTLMVQYAQ